MNTGRLPFAAILLLVVELGAVPTPELWAGPPATVSGTLTTEVQLEELRKQVEQQRSLKSQLEELQTEIGRLEAERAGLQQQLDEFLQLYNLLVEWSQASLIIGDQRSEWCFAIRESGPSWTVTSVVGPALRPYVLAAAVRAGRQCRSDAQIEARLLEAWLKNPAKPAVPFTVPREKVELVGSPSPPPAASVPAAITPGSHQPEVLNHLYQVILISARENIAPLVLGIGVPITDRCLATSGYLLSELPNYSDLSLRLAIRRQQNGGELIPIQRFEIHPNFQHQYQKQREFRQRLTTQLERTETDRRRFIQQLADMDAALAPWDIGVLVTDKPFPHVPRLSARPLAARDSIQVVASETRTKLPTFDDASWQLHQGEVASVSSSSNPTLRVMVTSETALFGAPCVDAWGNLCGFCSSPLLTGPTAPGSHFYLVPVDRCLNLAHRSLGK